MISAGTTIYWPAPPSEGPVKVVMEIEDDPEEEITAVVMAQSLFELAY